MYYAGTFVGSSIACILLGLLMGLGFKSKAPNVRALFAAGIAWVLAGFIAGFGMANGGPYRFDAIVTYLPGALIAFFYLRWHYRKDWIENGA